MATAQPRAQVAGRALVPYLEGDVAAALLGLVAVAPLAAVDGGYAPTSWGWSGLAFAVVAGLAILLRGSFEPSRLELIVLAALAAFAAWTLATAAWSHDAGGSILSFERVLVYVSALGAASAVVRRRSYGALLGGVWAAATLVCGYAVATRLFPTHFPASNGLAGNRLATPVGYWNALGLLGAVGILLALGLAACSRARGVRAAAAASLVPLALALYFTFSRGGWIVLVLGALVAFTLDPRRLRFAAAAAVSAPWAALAVAVASRPAALTSTRSLAADAAPAGAHVARLALLFAVAAAVTAVAAAEAERRLGVRAGVRRGFAALLASAALAALVAGLVRYGGPVAAARSGWQSFATSSPQGGTNLNARLFSLSNSGRLDLWGVALDTWRAHPLLGAGAGTYQRAWLALRPDGAQAVNAHSLYLETLAETGPLGLLLLLAALAAPLAAAARARRRRLVPAAAGAYVALLAHLLFDWDWQLPGVALAPLLAGAALLAAAREPPVRARRWGVPAAVVASVTLALVCGLTLAGNRAVAAATSASTAADWPKAIAEARRALSWQPWSARPLRILGEAQLQQGRLAAARSTFRSALARTPYDWQLWLDLAFAGRTRAARRAAAVRAAALNPRSVEIDSVRGALGLPRRP